MIVLVLVIGACSASSYATKCSITREEVLAINSCLDSKTCSNKWDSTIFRLHSSNSESDIKEYCN